MNDYREWLADHRYEDLPAAVQQQVSAATYNAERKAWLAAQFFWKEVPSVTAPVGLPPGLSAAFQLYRGRQQGRRLPHWAVAAGMVGCFLLGGWLFSGPEQPEVTTLPPAVIHDTIFLEKEIITPAPVMPERLIRDTVWLQAPPVTEPVVVVRTDTLYIPVQPAEPTYVMTSTARDSALLQLLRPVQ